MANASCNSYKASKSKRRIRKTKIIINNFGGREVGKNNKTKLVKLQKFSYQTSSQMNNDGLPICLADKNCWYFAKILTSFLSILYKL